MTASWPNYWSGTSVTSPCSKVICSMSLDLIARFCGFVDALAGYSADR
jgi:hypothetical protein